MSFGSTKFEEFELTYLDFWQLEFFLLVEFWCFVPLWLWAVVTFLLTSWMYVFVYLLQEVVIAIINAV